MTWIGIALVAATILGLVNVLDSHLISRRMPGIRAFFFVVGIALSLFGIIILVLNPFPGGVPLLAWAITGLSVVARLLAVLGMLSTLRTEEVSRVVPVVYTYPIFVALMAVPLLGEDLSYLQWLAIALTVSGAVLISMRIREAGFKTGLRRSFTLLMGASVLLALSDTGTKYALDYITFWNIYAITGISFGAGMILISTRRSVLRQLRSMANLRSALTLVTLNETLAVGGALLSFLAISRGPVSLVSTITSTRPLFVLVFALALSFAFPGVLNERFTRGVVFIKGLSIGLIVAGILLINIAARST